MVKGIIVGSGLGGYNFAKELRKQGYTGSLSLITADGGDFYSKPMLSNALTKGKSAEQLVMSTAKEMAAQLDLEVLINTQVEKVDVEQRLLTVQDEDIPFDRLLLAIGATPKALLRANSCTVPGLFSINHLEDYRKFRHYLASALSRAGDDSVKVAIVGAGLVGCELANDLAAASANSPLSVTLVEPSGRCLGSLLPDPISLVLGAALEREGVELLFDGVAGLNSVDNQKISLQLTGGDEREFDIVLSAIGIQPNTHLARAAGLEVNKGIVVNKYLQTSCPNIFALGDCAEVNGHTLFYVLPLMASVRALANSWASNKTVEVSYEAMPVVVKTPACPLVIGAPSLNSEADHSLGDWMIESGDSEVDMKALRYASNGELQSFVLSGSFTSERNKLKKLLPKLF